jgi:hypothetical protein
MIPVSQCHVCSSQRAFISLSLSYLLFSIVQNISIMYNTVVLYLLFSISVLYCMYSSALLVRAQRMSELFLECQSYLFLLKGI